jgi:hypothetical protein
VRAWSRSRGERAAAGLALAASLAASPARAQVPEPLEVTVRGSSAGAFVSRASTDTTPREPIDAATLLDELPSVHIRRLGADGAFASISVRGSTPSQVGVVLGGIPLTSAADPAFDVGSLPLWPGASFRVYRGFAPASLGTTGYLGGVLAIEPPSPAVGERTEEWAAVGSFGALKLRLGDLRRVGVVELGSGFFASRSDGDFPFVQQQIGGVGPIRVIRRTNAGQLAVGAIERVAVQRPWGSVAALILADARRTGVAGTERAQTRLVTLSTTRLVAGIDVGVNAGPGAVRATGWARRETSSLADPAGELDATHASVTRSAVEAAGASVGWRGRPHPAITLGLVLDGRGERFVPLSTEGGQVSAPASRLAAGVGVDLEWRPTQRLTASASARVDARRDDAAGFITTGGGASHVVGDVAPTGHLGASYRFGDAAIVSAHVGALERPPGFQELYGNGASLLANPALRPEHAFSGDAGIAGDVGDDHVRFGYELVGFASAARDLIVFTPFGFATFRAANVDRALLGGAEVTASLAARGARLAVSYTLLLSEDEADGRPLPGRPRHDLAYDASYRFGPVRLRYGVDVVSGVLIDRLPLPPRIFHGAGVGLDVPGVAGLRVAVDVANLFDQRVLYVPSPSLGMPVIYPVSDFLGYPLPGRTFWGTLRFVRPASGR